MIKPKLDPKTQCYYCGELLDICTAAKMKSPTLCADCFKDVKTTLATAEKIRKKNKLKF